jgi:hypothetical protein
MSKPERGKSPEERWAERDATFNAWTDAMQAVIRAELPEMPGKAALIACARVGSVESLPASERLELIRCTACGADLWITARLKESIEAKGLIVKAVCVSGCDGKPGQAETSP